MSALSLALSLSIALALAHDGMSAADADLSLGGFICVRPLSPTCADEPETLTTTQALSACQSELDRFALATTAYRDCMERQIGSAMRHANEVIDRFRCLSQPHNACASPAIAP